MQRINTQLALASVFRLVAISLAHRTQTQQVAMALSTLGGTIQG